jgi:hypothetical protein
VVLERDVFEGAFPFWADVDTDGMQDIVTTASNANVGAQLRVYRSDGTLLAASLPIGTGNRWRHQLAFGAFGPNGENELVEVQTPHIGGIVQYLRYVPPAAQDGVGALEVVARQRGFTSHDYGSFNMDMAVGGDFNGDGLLEIVLTDQGRDRVVGLQRTADDVQEQWSFLLNGEIATNFAAAQQPDGGLALAVGTNLSKLHIWRSR